MRHALYKYTLMQGVSFGALTHALCVSPAIQSELSSVPAAYGFLARVKLWLRILFTGMRGEQMSATLAVRPIEAKPNRNIRRKAKRKTPLARQADALGYHIMRRRGYAACLNWTYKRTLTARIVWCFKDWTWRGMARICFASSADMGLRPPHCAAPLSPD